MNMMKVWMGQASAEEKVELAKLAETSLGTLHQIAGGYRSEGRAAVRAKLASKIERAAAAMSKRNKKLPTILRTDLSPECRECDFARRCLGSKTAESGFGVVEES